MIQSELRFTAKHLDAELALATAITDRVGRDLFEGVTDTAERKARARIAIIVDKLEA